MDGSINAFARAKAAAQEGTLGGVLWLQGERDSTSAEDTATYESGSRKCSPICARS